MYIRTHSIMPVLVKNAKIFKADIVDANCHTRYQGNLEDKEERRKGLLEAGFALLKVHPCLT